MGQTSSPKFLGSVLESGQVVWGLDSTRLNNQSLSFNVQTNGGILLTSPNVICGGYQQLLEMYAKPDQGSYKNSRGWELGPVSMQAMKWQYHIILGTGPYDALIKDKVATTSF